MNVHSWCRTSKRYSTLYTSHELSGVRQNDNFVFSSFFRFVHVFNAQIHPHQTIYWFNFSPFFLREQHSTCHDTSHHCPSGMSRQTENLFSYPTYLSSNWWLVADLERRKKIQMSSTLIDCDNRISIESMAFGRNIIVLIVLKLDMFERIEWSIISGEHIRWYDHSNPVGVNEMKSRVAIAQIKSPDFGWHQIIFAQIMVGFLCCCCNQYGRFGNNINN